MDKENDRQIDDVLGNVLKDDVPADVEQRLRSQLAAFRSRLGEMEKSRPLAGRSLFPWRGSMRSPAFRLSAGAVLVLAVAGVALWFHAGGTQYALADFVKPVLEAKSATLKAVLKRNGKQFATANWMMLGPHRSRRELQQPDQPVEITVADTSKGMSVRLDSVRKVAFVNRVVGLSRELATMNPIEEIRSLVLGAERPDVRRESLGEREVDGKRAVGWRVSGPGLHAPGATLTIWGDPRTGLPIRIDSSDALTGLQSTLSDFVFNVDLDKSLFSIEIPAGYTVETLQVDASPPTEKDLIALLRQYSEWMNNAFPQALDWDRLLRTLQARISLETMIPGNERPSDEFLRKITEAGTDEEMGKILQAEMRKKSPAEQLRRMVQKTPPDELRRLMRNAKPAKEKAKALEAFTAKSLGVQMTITRGLGFVAELPREANAHYAGKGVSRGASGTPIFWYRPKDAKKYRVIYADLSVREADTPPHVSKAQPVPAAPPPSTALDAAEEIAYPPRPTLSPPASPLCRSIAMGLVTRLLVLSVSLFLDAQTALGDAATTTNEPAQPAGAQDARCVPRMSRRAMRRRNVVCVADPAEQQQNKEEKLPARVYQLTYAKPGDVAAVVKPLLSSKGTVETTSDPAKAANGILIVRDDEQVLKTVDQVIAKIDAEPAQVLVEATIVEITLSKDARETKGAGEPGVVGDGALNAAGSMPTVPGESKLAQQLMADTNDAKIGLVGKPKEFLQALRSFGDTKILAAPRLLVFNKQRAEVHLGDQLTYRASAAGQAAAKTTVKYLDLGTTLRVRPFVSRDGYVRLEAHTEITTGHVDDHGVPQTDTWAMTTNVMMSDGATVAIGGPHSVEAKPAAQKQQIFLFTTHLWKPQGDTLTFAPPGAKL
jgi:outer membrane lipoprotein-sorting protein